MGNEISKVIANCSIVGLGEADSVEKAKHYYLELGDQRFAIIKKGLEYNEDIDTKLRELDIIWPKYEDDVLDSQSGFFYDTNQLNGRQAIEWI